jgi:hypothetical protein
MHTVEVLALLALHVMAVEEVHVASSVIRQRCRRRTASALDVRQRTAAEIVLNLIIRAAAAQVNTTQERVVGTTQIVAVKEHGIAASVTRESSVLGCANGRRSCRNSAARELILNLVPFCAKDDAADKSVVAAGHVMPVEEVCMTVTAI